MKLNLPLYKAELKDCSGITAVALVEYPAVESDFLTFKKEEEQKQQSFSADEEKHNIIGCVLRADFPIYRRSGDYEYYVVFQASTIEEMTKKMFMDASFAVNNTQHVADNDVSDKLETLGYFIKNTGMGIAPVGFDNVEDGSLFGIYHVKDDNLWKEIKEGKLNGFSVECIMNYVEDFSTEDSEEREILNMIEKIKNKLK